jgi:hypothetical protein
MLTHRGRHAEIYAIQRNTRPIKKYGRPETNKHISLMTLLAHMLTAHGLRNEPTKKIA